MRETHRLVVAHIAKIRRIRNLEDCTIVLCLESNLAYECQHIIHAIQAAGVRKWVSLQVCRQQRRRHPPPSHRRDRLPIYCSHCRKARLERWAG